MTECAAVSPSVGYGDFLDQAFSQIDAAAPVIKSLCGPHFETFAEQRAELTARLHEVDPRLEIPNLWPADNRPPEVAAVTKTIESEPGGGGLTHDLYRVRMDWGKALTAYTQEAAPMLAAQHLEPGVLDVPPYHAQGEYGDYENYHLTCTLAAYRMVFEGVAGWVPSELDMVAQLQERYNTVSVPDEVYLKLMATEAFREYVGKQVKSIAMPGTDFDHINLWANKLKNTPSKPQVYAVADLGTRDTLSGTLFDFHTHRVVLHHATADGVVFHDPKREVGKNKQLSHKEFTRRWAATHNMTRLVIAQDVR